MGCKSLDACKNNRLQNFSNRWHPQCRPDKKRGPSVCRQCCDKSPDCGQKIMSWSLNKVWGWKNPNFVTYKPGRNFSQSNSAPKSATTHWEDRPSESGTGFQVSREKEIETEERIEGSRAFQRAYSS